MKGLENPTEFMVSKSIQSPSIIKEGLSMDLNKDIMKDLSKKPNSRGDEEIKKRFRGLLREGINLAASNGHNMQIETVKLEETHMWASLECKDCGGVLYLDADRRWQKDKIFGFATVTNCKPKK